MRRQEKLQKRRSYIVFHRMFSCTRWNVCGMLVVGLFPQFSRRLSGQFLAQLMGTAALIRFVLLRTRGLNWLLSDSMRGQLVQKLSGRAGGPVLELETS
jgi:hypothetical protein